MFSIEAKQLHYRAYALGSDLPQQLALANAPFCAHNTQRNISEAIVHYFLRGDDVLSRTPLDLWATLQLARRVRHYRLIDLVECVCIQRFEVASADLAAELCALKGCMSAEFGNILEWRNALDIRAGCFVESLNAFQRLTGEVLYMIDRVRAARAGKSYTSSI